MADVASPPTLGTDTERRQQAIDLLYRYVRQVDSRQVDAWPSYFAAEAEYIVISRENHERGLPVCFIHDDVRDRIDDRITFLKEIWTEYDDYWPRHILSTVTVDVDGDRAHLQASFAMYVTEQAAGNTRLLATGEYQDEIVFEDGEPKFASKRVILDTTVLPRYFVYPL